MSDNDKKPPEIHSDAEEQDDRTILFDGSDGSDGDSVDDNEKTILATSSPVSDPSGSEPPATDDEDRTIVAAQSPAASNVEDDERTIIASEQPQQDPGSASDKPPETVVDETEADQTIVLTGSGTSDPDGPQGAVPPVEDDATVVVTKSTTGSPDAVTSPQTATSSMVPLQPGTAPTPLSALEPGLVINNMYRVEERLDQGGMGRVFRGVEIGTGEPVAIKVILPEMAEDVTVARMFRREARTLRQLHHDAIVRYFAYVPPDERLNLHALVMGFIEGTKLSDKLKESGALDRKQVIKLTLRLAEGLEKAHDIGVVHRDLSPDNVMLQGGRISKAVIIDFGIARSSTLKDVTIGNEFAGKLKYVSPEQLGAFGGVAEAPSDIYSLGLLMIAMLIGAPFNMGTNMVEAVQRRQDVPDLSELPQEFQGLLTGMLQPNPAERIQSMGAVIEALRELDGGGSTFSPTHKWSTTPPAPDRSVPGLQAVPISATITPTSKPAPISNEAREAVRRQSGGAGGRILVVLLILLLAAGGAGFYFFGDQIMLQSTAADEPEVDPVEAGLRKTEGSRATFLASSVPDGCALALLRTRGPSAGLIETFGKDSLALRGIGAAFGTEFGASPEVLGRDVLAEHCSVLDFVRSFQGTQGGGIEIEMVSNVSPRADGIVGSIHGSAGRENWLALVGPTGQVFSLVRQLNDPIGDQRRFAFRMPTAPPGVYLVLATASESGLVRAGAMQDGTMASDILPLMLRELATDNQGAVDVAYLRLLQ